MRPALLAVPIAAGVVLAAGSAHAGISVSPGPSLRATTTMAGQQSPVALARGSWQATGINSWRLVERSAAPLAGTTSVSAAWTTPPELVRKGQVVLTTSWSPSDKPVPRASYDASEQVRICIVGHSCGRWLVSSMPSPRSATLGLLHASVVGTATVFAWVGDPVHAFVQWRYSQVQRRGDVATTQITVANH